jgi:UDP-N-acetylglucosamine 1-carboxyvinyltransferase
MQPQMAVLLGIAEGTSTVTESIFENRFKYVDELTRMGADIKVESNIAIISGVPKYTGARVNAPDLRAGAALVIAGLAAEGITVVDDIYYIERGYEHLDKKLRGIGAQIEKVADEKEVQKFILKVS